MKKSVEVEFCTDLLYVLPREDKIMLISNSNLYENECELLIHRYVEGKTIKESAEIMNIGYDAFLKAQRRIINKLYLFIHNNLEISKFYYNIIKK